MTEKHDISEDEIRIIGGSKHTPSGRKHWWIWVLLAAAIVAVAVLVIELQKDDIQTSTDDTQTTEGGEQTTEVMENATPQWLDNIDNSLPSGIILSDTIIDSLHLRVLTPINTTPELYIGKLSESDTDILLATMAADIRRDNGKIVGAYVYGGEPLSWGLSKRGYCAIFDGRMTIGTADNSPLFEQATEQGGYFFRQYAAVQGGNAVENNPENAAPRRALCVIASRYCIVASDERVTMNDFSEALTKLHASEAIYLVGGMAHGWWRDDEGHIKHFIEGNDRPINKKYLNYIVFRKN